MVQTQTTTTKTVGKVVRPSAMARMVDLPISPKHGVEISNALRWKTTTYARRVLEGVIALEKPIKFTRYDQDLGHKPGIGAGRFPQKAAQSFLKLVASVEANAQHKGLNVSNLKIIKLIANKGAIPQTGGRIRRSRKRANLEIEVCEAPMSQKKSAVKSTGAGRGAAAKPVKK